MKFNNKLFNKVSHVIFDLDGTILDTETLYREALQRIADIYDKDCNNDVILKIAGMTQPMIAETIIEDFDLPVDVKTFLDQYNGFIDTRIGHCDLMPGKNQELSVFEQYLPFY
ncbi:unnamed protein product [Ceutorhynchus assimilis]|uniref:Uncharacterized protein n=1 Tax=Ceutorhynchus assimilis TaxID=467358 RepID=A0A9N9MPS9_9CUCU|nr:unnamed protein product [Ceutorhynchus assimilis]